MKKTILHIIDFMGRGGAETMLVKVLKELDEYHNIVVTVNEQNNFGDEFVCDEYHCLHMGSFSNLPLAVFRMKNFLKGRQVDLVHSHLLLSTLIARMATPRRIPLITTVHTNVAQSNDYKKWYLRALDQFTWRLHRSIIIGVSKCVLEDYCRFLKRTPYRSYLLYTFVDVKAFISKGRPSKKEIFRLVAVGALRFPKNQDYLIRAFAQLKGKPFELHIYGTGVREKELQQLIDSTETGSQVVLKGEISGVHDLLGRYDAYVMPSLFEGFSLSVLEAMAMEIPMLLSDIPTFREQCEGTALYFDLNEEKDFIEKLEQLSRDAALQQQLAAGARQRVVDHFTLEHHMQGLRDIYNKTLKKLKA